VIGQEFESARPNGILVHKYKKCQNEQIFFNQVTMPSNLFKYRYKQQEIVEPMVQKNPFPREQCRQLLNKPLGPHLQHNY
jgi:hypothetical protein